MNIIVNRVKLSTKFLNDPSLTTFIERFQSKLQVEWLNQPRFRAPDGARHKMEIHGRITTRSGCSEFKSLF
jgi:hypothetical protein